MVRLTRAIEFSSSLRYRSAGNSDAENEEMFGLAAKQHGHNYRLEVTVCGEPDPKSGMVMNLVELKAVLEREVMSRFDHKDLNADTDYFKDVPPTPENLATLIHEILEGALPPGMFDSLRLYQDADLYVDVHARGD
ncbi:MAG: 6-pyruvoyltetrahydropterin/6-carboxytetrahydropterin synthase [Myxococcota bacterium]